MKGQIHLFDNLRSGFYKVLEMYIKLMDLRIHLFLQTVAGFKIYSQINPFLIYIPEVCSGLAFRESPLGHLGSSFPNLSLLSGTPSLNWKPLLRGASVPSNLSYKICFLTLSALFYWNTDLVLFNISILLWFYWETLLFEAIPEKYLRTCCNIPTNCRLNASME